MKSAVLKNTTHKSFLCPILLEETINALKQKRFELIKNLTRVNENCNSHTRTTFTLTTKDLPDRKFELKIYK